MNYLLQLFLIGGQQVYKDPTLPNINLAVSGDEITEQKSLTVADDWLPTYVTRPAKDLYKMSNKDIQTAIASGALTPNDFSLNVTAIALMTGGFY